MMKIPRIEQETVITYNAQEDFAEIYTCYPPMIRKLDKLAQENPDEWKMLRVQSGGKTYSCPKELVSFRKGSIKRTATQKEAAKSRMQKLNLTRQKGEAV